MNSLEVREFEQTLRNYVNNIQLPWEVKKNILTAQAIEAAEKADAEIAQELEEREKANE